MKVFITQLTWPLLLVLFLGIIQKSNAQVTILGSGVASPPAKTCTNTTIDISVQLNCANAAHVGNSFTVVGTTITIDVDYVVGIICLPAFITVNQSVNLGMLPAGSYTLIINGKWNSTTTSTRLSTLPISGCCPYTSGFTVSKDSVCPGDYVNFINTSVGSFVSQNWFKNNTFQASTQNYVDTFGRIGNNYVKLVLDDGSCIDSVIKNVYVNPFPSVDLGNDTSYCIGRSLALSVGSGFDSVLWSTSQTATGITVVNPGTYSVEVFEKGCSSNDTINVTSRPSPSVDLGPDTGLCTGSTILLDATTAGVTYKWQDNSTTPTYTVQNPGTYSVTVTNMDNCKAYDEVRVLRYAQPIVDLGEDSIACQGDTIFLDGTINGAANYLWQDGSGGSTFNATKTNIFWVQAEDTNGCNAIDSVSIAFINCHIGLEEFSKQELTTFPNPVNNQLKLKTNLGEAVLKYEIFSLSGVKTMTGKVYFDLSGEATIKADQLPRGMYLLQIINDGEVLQSKFIKE